MMEFDSNKFSPKIAYLLSVVAFMAVNLLGINSHISNLSNTVFTPIMFLSSELGNGIKSSYDAIGSIDTITIERNDLLIENAQLHAENSIVQILKDRVEVLEDELDLIQKESRLFEVSVINGGDGEISDILIVNGGEDIGIHDGDIAKIGNVYIGTVERVNSRSARVLLPTYGKSYLQVLIIPANEDISKLSIEDIDGLISSTSTKVWSGVAIGSTNGIEIENIEKNADIKIGDHVIVNDSDVGFLLYLGDLSKITVDPTEVQITASVALPLNYRNITNLMILQEVE